MTNHYEAMYTNYTHIHTCRKIATHTHTHRKFSWERRPEPLFMYGVKKILVNVNTINAKCAEEITFKNDSWTSVS